jgi:hypothetical protein
MSNCRGSLQFQQNVSKRGLGLVVLCGASNALEDLLPLVPAAVKAIGDVLPGQVIRVAVAVVPRVILAPAPGVLREAASR